MVNTWGEWPGRSGDADLSVWPLKVPRAGEAGLALSRRRPIPTTLRLERDTVRADPVTHLHDGHTPLEWTAAGFSCRPVARCFPPVVPPSLRGPEVLRTAGAPPMRPHRAFALRPVRDEDREPVLFLDHLGSGSDHMVRTAV